MGREIESKWGTGPEVLKSSGPCDRTKNMDVDKGDQWKEEVDRQKCWVTHVDGKFSQPRR